MKTQIKDLISGRKDVIIDDKNAKYDNANKATSHNGFAGTKREERNEIARRVKEENPNGLNIEIKGVPLSLKRLSSLSGKTVWFEANLTEEEYKRILGFGYPSTGSQWMSALLVNIDMTVEIQLLKRKNSNSNWRYNRNFKIGEEFITIL